MGLLSAPAAGIDVHPVFYKPGVLVYLADMGVAEHHHLVAVLFAQIVSQFFQITLVGEHSTDLERLIMVLQVCTRSLMPSSAARTCFSRKFSRRSPYPSGENRARRSGTGSA